MTYTNSDMPTQTTLSPKLYLLTNEDPFTLLYDKLTAAFATGVVDVIQVRRKTVQLQQGSQAVYEEAQQIMQLADHYGVTVVINDDMQLASRLGAGVHLGQDDGEVNKARQLLGKHALIGCSCYGSIDLVKQAKAQGASYAALGALFNSPTKPHAAVIDKNVLLEAAKYDIDLCVIGGITADNVHLLQAYRLQYIAVVSDILQLSVNQIKQRCQQWQHTLQICS